MKVIVDEMPKEPKECIFNVGGDTDECVINNRCRCGNVSRCEYLKPITECYAVKKITEDTAIHIPIE